MSLLIRKEAQISYEASPQGEKKDQVWVTLVNGHSRSSRDFRAFSKFLGEKGFSVLILDNRGSGQTQSPPFTFLDMQEDILALWDELEIPKSHLMGISYGGVICQNLAAMHSGKVKSLVLVSTTFSSRFLTERKDLSALSLEERNAEMAKYFGEKFTQDNPVLFKSLTLQMAKEFENAGTTSGAQMQRAALKEFDFSHLVKSITCPCLILHGARDQIIPSIVAQKLHHLVHGSKLEEWPEIGHLFLAEKPKEFYQRVVDFFSGIECT